MIIIRRTNTAFSSTSSTTFFISGYCITTPQLIQSTPSPFTTTMLTNSPNPSHVHRLIICFSFSANRRGVVNPTRANANTQTVSLRRNVYAQLLQDTRRLLLNTLTRIVTTATSASEFNARFPTDTSFFSSQLEVFLLRYAYFSRIFDCSAGWCVR